MGKKTLFHRQKAPTEELAAMMAERGFLLLPDVSKLSGVDEELTLAMIKQFGMKPYVLETKSGKHVNGYVTSKVKKMLAARGRIVPGFNQDHATQRQWLEILESTITKPLDKTWYFQPVNPDPLVVVSEDKAGEILGKIKKYAGFEDPPSEVLRLIADLINIETREDLPLRPNSKWKGAGGGLFGKRRG